MHLQTEIPAWDDAVRALPRRSMVKAFDPRVLARARWLRPDVITCYRRHGLEPDPSGDFAEAREHWRALWADVAGPEFRTHAHAIDLVEECNEYTSTAMCHDLARLKPAITSAQAAVAVWNDELRGRGGIPAGCRVVVCNSPVENDVPRQYYELAVAGDAVLGVHPYTRYHAGRRDPQDWPQHSGRWAFNEDAYGVRPVYAFTECGPYAGVAEGWRHPTVLAGDVGALAAAMAAWVGDVAQTRAYREGRILGPGAWFTAGEGVGWEYYQLSTGELVAIADALRPLWRPGGESDVDAALQAEILRHVDAIRALLAPSWWHTLAPRDRVRVIAPTWVCTDPALTHRDRTRAAGEVLDVWQSRGGATWAGEAVCVFSASGLELWASAAALERA